MHDPNKPHTYPRRVLLAATGLSPQVVTETIYALSIKQRPAFVPTEVHLLTTLEGKRNAELTLLKGNAWLSRLCGDYHLPAVEFSPKNIHVIGMHEPLQDIRSESDNNTAANHILKQVHRLTLDANCALHVSIAGGRKSMGFLTGYALSLYGRQQDRLSHVLVSNPYEALPEFFYPLPRARVVYDRSRRPHDASQAEVTLANIPFVRLRDGVPEGLITGDESFGEAVEIAQQSLQAPRLIIDQRNRQISADGHSVRMPPRELAFLSWLARRRVAGKGGVPCPMKGVPETEYTLPFLTQYRAIIGEMGDDDRVRGALARGMESDYFSETKSRLNTRIRNGLALKIGVARARMYCVGQIGPRGQQKYGLLDLAESSIEFREVTP